MEPVLIPSIVYLSVVSYISIQGMEVLKLNEFFKSLNPGALKKMLAAPSFEVETYGAGETLFKQGDPTDGKLRIVHVGEVKGTVVNPDGLLTR
jgi:CRP-like cAMP-binding protein